MGEAKVSELSMASPRAMPSPSYQSETKAGPNQSQKLSENEGIILKYPAIMSVDVANAALVGSVQCYAKLV